MHHLRQYLTQYKSLFDFTGYEYRKGKKTLRHVIIAGTYQWVC